MGQDGEDRQGLGAGMTNWRQRDSERELEVYQADLVEARRAERSISLMVLLSLALSGAVVLLDVLHLV
jgi:hypothetical protein